MAGRRTRHVPPAHPVVFAAPDITIGGSAAGGEFFKNLGISISLIS
jgi:hypothetical protein